MIRKTFFIIAIITLGALSALGNTPNNSETSAAGKTPDATATSAATLQDCAFARIEVSQPQLLVTSQHLIKVSWTVPFICAPVKITGYAVAFTLRNNRGEEFTVTPILGPQATSSTINVPAAQIPRFFGSAVGGTFITVEVKANLALKNPAAFDTSLALIQTSAPAPPPASNLKLDITDIKINGSNRSNPITMQVTWAVDKPASAFVKGAYNLTLDLSGNGVTGKVVQTPSSSNTSVAVGLLGIPADVRAKLFDPKFPLTAVVTLKAIIISDGQEKSVEVKESKTFPPIS